MYKKYFNQTLLVFLSLLAAPLHAAQYGGQGDDKKDNDNIPPNQNSRYRPSGNKRQIGPCIKPKSLNEEQEHYENLLKIQAQHYGALHPNTAKNTSS